MRKAENTKTDGKDRPVKEVVIADCGAEVVAEPFGVSKEDAVNFLQFRISLINYKAVKSHSASKNSS